MKLGSLTQKEVLKIIKEPQGAKFLITCVELAKKKAKEKFKASISAKVMPKACSKHCRNMYLNPC
jgi:hypothetical protein